MWEHLPSPLVQRLSVRAAVPLNGQGLGWARGRGSSAGSWRQGSVSSEKPPWTLPPQHTDSWVPGVRATPSPTKHRLRVLWGWLEIPSKGSCPLSPFLTSLCTLSSSGQALRATACGGPAL